MFDGGSFNFSVDRTAAAVVAVFLLQPAPGSQPKCCWIQLKPYVRLAGDDALVFFTKVSGPRTAAALTLMAPGAIVAWS